MFQLPTQAMPAAPTPQLPAPMPDPSSPAVLEAQRATAANIMARAGRSSTILTTPKTRGDYGNYSGKTLG